MILFSFLKYKKYVKHILIWAVLWGLLYVLTNTQTTVNDAILRTNFNIIVICVLSYSGRFFVSSFYEKKEYHKWVFYGVALCLFFVLLRLFVELFVFKKSLFGPNYENEIKIINVFYQGLFYFILVAVIFTSSSFYEIAKERRRIEYNLQLLQLKHVEAQLNYLRSQINPHFLFNMLHNIYSAVTLKKEVAGEMILKLSDLLHYVTYDGLQKKVLLETELQKMQSYISLFRLKTPQVLDISFDVFGVNNTYSIEPVLLLPFIENALKHSDLQTRNRGSFLKVVTTVSNGELHLQVRNSFNPDNQQKDGTGGVGLENIRSRLHLLYPNQHTISIISSNNIYSVNLTINLNYTNHA